MCLPSYYQSTNGFMLIHALWRLMYGYVLLLELTKECSTSQERNIIKLVRSNSKHRVLKSYRSKMSVMYMCHESLLIRFRWMEE